MWSCAVIHLVIYRIGHGTDLNLASRNVTHGLWPGGLRYNAMIQTGDLCCVMSPLLSPRMFSVCPILSDYVKMLKENP